MQDSVQRLLFEDLDIRGAIVRLGPSWQAMQAGRGYPEAVARLLGEMTAVTTIIAAQLKQPGRLTFQLRGDGPLSLLVIDCNENLEFRGMARTDGLADGDLPLERLWGHGQLMLTLDLPQAKDPYQSFVPLEGNTIAEVFEHYLQQSEQQPSRLYLAASEQGVTGLFLQTLPGAHDKDADGWNRLQQLAATLRPEELLGLETEVLLSRVFAEETLRLYPPRSVTYSCPEDWEKVRSMLRAVGREEAESILQEHGEILIRDDICNREYRFDAAAVAELFSANPPTLH